MSYLLRNIDTLSYEFEEERLSWSWDQTYPQFSRIVYMFDVKIETTIRARSVVA